MESKGEGTMTVNHKVTGTAVSMPAGIGFGCGISMILTLLGASVIAKLIAEEILKETAIGYGAMATILLASISGSLIAVKKVKKRKLQVSMLVGVGYFMLLLAMTALFFGGRYQGMGVTALLVFAGSGTVILAETRSKKSGKFRKGKRVP